MALPQIQSQPPPACRTIQINCKQHYLWRAVDLDGDVVDVYLQAKRDGAVAKRFFKRLLRSHGGEPRKIVTDKLRSCEVAHWGIVPEAIHVTDQYANNRVEQFTSCGALGTPRPSDRSEVFAAVCEQCLDSLTTPAFGRIAVFDESKPVRSPNASRHLV